MNIKHLKVIAIIALAGILPMALPAQTNPRKKAEIPSAPGAKDVKSAKDVKPGKLFKDADGRFQVLMPGPVARQTQKVPTDVGTVLSIQFIAQYGKSAYIVSYVDYPDKLIIGADAKQILQGARNGMLRNTGAKLDAEKNIRLSGYPGLYLRASKDPAAGKPGYRMRVKIFMVRARLYTVMAISPDKDVD